MLYVDSNSIDNVLGLSAPTKVFLILFNVAIIIVGLSGNVFVLYSSIKHKAIKMDRVTLLFIESIAFSDILIILLSYLPMFITLSADKWVLGNALCYMSGMFFQFIPFINEILTIAMISCYRLWVLKKPAATRENIQSYQVRILMLAILLLATSPALGSIIIKNYAYFDPDKLNCVVQNSSQQKIATHASIVLSIFLIIPMLIVIITNILILCIVKKVAEKSGRGSAENKTTAITIASICWAFILSYLPVFVGVLLQFFAPRVNIPNWYPILYNSSIAINVVVNPFIYALTNKRFRHHSKNSFKGRNRKDTLATVRPS